MKFVGRLPIEIFAKVILERDGCKCQSALERQTKEITQNETTHQSEKKDDDADYGSQYSPSSRPRRIRCLNLSVNERERQRAYSSVR
jgi:hypothetical protein